MISPSENDSFRNTPSSLKEPHQGALPGTLELLDEEQVLEVIQPTGGFAMRANDTVIIPFVFFFIVLSGGLVYASMNGHAPALMPVVLFVPLLFIAARRFVLRYIKTQSTTYVITNLRCVFINKRGVTDSVFFNNVGPIYYRFKSRNRGTIILGPIQPFHSSNYNMKLNLKDDKHAMDNLPDFKRIAQLVKTLHAEQKRSTFSCKVTQGTTIPPLLTAIGLMLFISTSTAQGYSPWSIDTIHGFEGRYIVIQSSTKQLRRSSVNKVRRIETYYNACDQITKRTSTTSKGSFAPRPVRVKEKVWKTDCTLQQEGTSIDQIENTLLSYLFRNDSLLFTSELNDTLSFRIINLFGAPFKEGFVLPSSSSHEPPQLFFPWSGQFVIEIYHNASLIFREQFTNAVLGDEKLKKRSVVRFRPSN